MIERFKVDFETKCYENDWIYLLKTSYLKRNIERCNFMFETRRLIINNVNDRKLVASYADKAVARNIIDEWAFAEDHAEKVLKHFNLTKESFKKGYYYSIAELAGIYLCQSPYLLHFSSDAFMGKKDYNWITKGLEQLSTKEDVVVVNPTWNCKFEEAKNESVEETDQFYVGYGFSDQCYLVNTDLFKKEIYGTQHPDSERYPLYGGELFEKRVDSYMRNHQLKRLTHKQACYRHHNFPKKGFSRFLRFLRPM